MATNQRGHGKRVRITASAARSSGDLVYEDGFHGVVPVDIADTERGELDISQVEYEVDLLAGADPGEAVYITTAGALTLTAGTNRLVGFVTANPTVEPDAVPAGKMWILIAPQNTTVPA